MANGGRTRAGAPRELIDRPPPEPAETEAAPTASEATVEVERAAEPEASRGRRELLLDVAAGLLVLVAYAIGQLVFLLGPQPFDPAYYFQTAVEFPDIPPDRWTLRVGLMLPVVAAVRVLGPGEASLYAVPFATGLVLAAAVYLTMLLLFRQRVLAIAAALLTVLNANYLLNSSFIFPDTTGTATLAAGFFFLVLGAAEFRNEAGRWLGVSSALAAGTLFGASYLVREFSPLLLPAVVAAVVLLRYPVRRVALVAGAALATVLSEIVYGALVFGRPLVHARVLVTHRGERTVQEELDSVFEVLFLFPRLLASWRFGWLFIVLIVWFVVALAWFRDRRLWLFASWLFVFWGSLVVLGLASLPSGKWLLNVSNIRYWYPAFPPLVMGALGGLALCVQRFWPGARGALLTSGLSVAVALLVLVPGFVQFDRCSAKDVWRNDPLTRWQALRAWFETGAASGYSVLWTDIYTTRLVPAFTRTTFGESLWDGEARVFPGGDSPVLAHLEPSSLILVHKDRFEVVRGAQRKLDKLRAGWHPLFTTSDGQMVVLAQGAAGTADAAPADQRWWDLTAAPVPEGEGCGLKPGK